MNKIRAVVFDAYGTLFDVYSVTARAEQLFPGRGEALALLWRDRQIDYTRIRTMAAPDGSRYKPFWAITVDALRYAAERLSLTLDEAAEAQLLKEYACLSAFPENLGALKRLRRARLPLGILSNGNAEMLDISVKSSGMHGLFDHVLSVDAVRQYKTAPATYALGPQAFSLPAEEMLFVSSNGWDACGATWFGYTTFWINRAGHPAERLDVAPPAPGTT